MGIQLLGTDGTTVVEIDPGHRAQRVSLRPLLCTSWQSIATQTGLVTTLAAGAPLFSLRNTGSDVLLVRRLQVQWITTTTFTTAQRLEFGCYVARSFTVADSGGLPLSVASGKHRTAMSTPTLEARIALTSALTAGTRTLDSHPIGMGVVFSNAVGVTMPQTSLISQDPGDHPIVLGSQEGLVLSSMLAMGAAGVGLLYIVAEFAKAASY